jgi:WD40 repeat protein
MAVAAIRLDPATDPQVRVALTARPELMAVAGADITAAAPHPDGSSLAVAAADGTVTLVELPSLRPGPPLAPAASAPVGGLAFTPDGRRLVGWGGSGNITVWDLASGRVEGSPFGEVDPAATGGVLADGVTLLVTAGGGRSRPAAWNIEARTPSTAYVLPGSAPQGLFISPSGRHVAAGGWTGTTVVDVVSGAERAVPGAVGPSSLSPAGRSVLTVDGPTLLRWSVSSGERRELIGPHRAEIRATTWAADGRTFASVDADGAVVVWDAVTSRPRHTLTLPDGTPRLAQLSPDGSSLVTRSRSGSLVLWDLSGTRGLGPWVAAAPDTDTLARVACAVAGRDMTTVEWDRLVPGRPYRHVCPT